MTIAPPELNAEAPLPLLDRPLTPAGAFYRRTNFHVPRIAEAEWALRVDGGVERPLSLDLAALRALPRHEAAVTMECAGNGRASLTPSVPGLAWGLGAVSTASFAGARLRDVLEAAGVLPGAVEVLFTGADRGEVEPGRTVSFARSLPLESALDPEVLLAYEMDGAPLAPAHGFPLRVVVPRWYGVASVKWLTELRVLDTPFRGHFQAERYVYLEEAGIPDGTPVTRMRVRAVVAAPAEGTVLTAGSPTVVRGTAWSGEGEVTRVEASFDGGESWEEAELGEAPSPFAAAPWWLPWTPAAGAHEIVVRATDSTGRTQPLAQVWNALGYGNNEAQRVRVTAR